jgi:hypothetical protein
MLHFPAICVDNFYSEPDRVRDWALSLDYEPAPGGQWPGKRSEKLHIVDPNFFHNFCLKVFSLYFDLDKIDVDYVVHTQFQLIEPFDKNKDSLKNTGWIHYDHDSVFGGIIYLTPNIDPNCGTSIFYQHSDTPGEVSKNAKETFYKTGDATEYEKILQTHNKSFNETITYNNVYNRMISFDGETAHKANSFYTEIPRLTQVFFVDKIDANSQWPIERHRRYL